MRAHALDPPDEDRTNFVLAVAAVARRIGEPVHVAKARPHPHLLENAPAGRLPIGFARLDMTGDGPVPEARPEPFAPMTPCQEKLAPAVVEHDEKGPVAPAPAFVTGAPRSRADDPVVSINEKKPLAHSVLL